MLHLIGPQYVSSERSGEQAAGKGARSAPDRAVVAPSDSAASTPIRVIPDGGLGFRSAILTDMVDRPEMRASDADRDRIAAVLRDAHADGRLAQDELLERLGATYEARTYGDLDRLVADLPRPTRAPATRPAPHPARRAPESPARRSSGKTALTHAWWVWATAVSVNVVIWLLVSIMSTDIVYFWPAWVAGPWGAVLLMMTLANRGSNRGH